MTSAQWTQREEAILRLCHPDIPQILARLPHRSRAAIMIRSRSLGLAMPIDPYRRWSRVEGDTLARLWSDKASKQVILDALPAKTWVQIKDQVKRWGLGRRYKFRQADPVKASICRKAREKGLTNRQLDALVHSGNYFFDGRQRKGVTHILAAAEVLGLTVEIEWEPLLD